MKINIVNHYRKLLFYNFNRFKGNNYQSMREYFAQVFIFDIEKYSPLFDKKIIDIGGANGEFCKILHKERKCDAVNLDPAPSDVIWPNTVIASAEDIPFADNEFDLVICRGVLEHIPNDKQPKCLKEMYRVLKPDGLCYIVIPPWYNLHAGHRLKPFHLLPFKQAKFLRELIFKSKIDVNSYDEACLFPITFSRMLKMISKSDFSLIATKDTHFRLHFLTKIPILRELTIPAVAFILQK